MRVLFLAAAVMAVLGGPAAVVSASAEGRGVTEDAIRVGVMRGGTVEGGTDHLLGIAPPDHVTRAMPPEWREQYWDAAVADAMGRGGAGGRTLEAVWHEVYPWDSDHTEDWLDDACTYFTEEQEVFAVVLPLGAPAGFADCLDRAGVVLIGSDTTMADRGFYADHPLYADNSALNLSRVARLLVDNLVRRGFFAPGSRVGVVRYDGEQWARAAQHDLLPALAEHGIEPVAEHAVTTPPHLRSWGWPHERDHEAYREAHGRAVADFQALGVDRVLFLTGDEHTAAYFMEYAEAAGYRPRYGVSSQDWPDTLTSYSLAGQLRGAIGPGWLPVADVGFAGDDVERPGAQRCRAAMDAQGVSFGHPGQEYVAMITCDWVEFIKLAADAAPAPLTAETLMAGVERLDDSFASATVGTTSFSARRRDGVAEYRDLAYDDTCRCFRYVSGPLLVDEPTVPPPPAVTEAPVPPEEEPRTVAAAQPPAGPPAAGEPPPPPPAAAPPPPALSSPALPPGPAAAPAPPPAPAPAPAPAPQPVPAPDGAFVAADAAAANPALVPAEEAPEAAVRYAATGRSDQPGPALWLMVAATVCLAGGALGVRPRPAPAYAWARR